MFDNILNTFGYRSIIRLYIDIAIISAGISVLVTYFIGRHIPYNTEYITELDFNVYFISVIFIIVFLGIPYIYNRFIYSSVKTNIKYKRTQKKTSKKNIKARDTTTISANKKVKTKDSKRDIDFSKTDDDTLGFQNVGVLMFVRIFLHSMIIMYQMKHIKPVKN